MTDTISRTVHLPRESSDAVDHAVASGQFASADDLISRAVEALLHPVEILEGDELDELLGEEEPRESYLDGETVMHGLITRLEAKAAAR